MSNKTAPASKATLQVERNVAAVAEIELATLEQQSIGHRLSGVVAGAFGSLPVILLHVAFFAGWLLWNRPSATAPFDPYPHSLLTLIVALETILLSTIVLMNQDRMTKLADRRAHLTLQIDLLAESEMTKVLSTLRTITLHLGIPGVADDEEMRELATPTEVEHVIRALDEKLPILNTPAPSAPR